MRDRAIERRFRAMPGFGGWNEGKVPLTDGDELVILVGPP